MSRQLDKAIAEALGHEVVWVEEYLSEFMESTKHNVPVINYVDEDDYEHILSYSTDGNAMLELDREMRERGWVIKYHYFDWKDLHTVIYMKEKNGITQEAKVYQSDTEPLARALAAYKALTGKDWEEEGE